VNVILKAVFWQSFDCLAGIVCRTPQPEVYPVSNYFISTDFSSTRVVSPPLVFYIRQCADSTVPSSLASSLHVNYLHFLPHLYHIPTLWDSGTGLWELAIPWDTTMYPAMCNVLYFTIFHVNELQTSGYYHQVQIN